MKNGIKYIYKLNTRIDNMKYTITSKLFKEIYNTFTKYIKPFCVTIEYINYNNTNNIFGIVFMINTENYITNEKLINDFITAYQLHKYLEIIDIVHIKAQKYFQTTLKIKLTKIGEKHKKDLLSMLLLRE